MEPGRPEVRSPRHVGDGAIAEDTGGTTEAGAVEPNSRGADEPIAAKCAGGNARPTETRADTGTADTVSNTRETETGARARAADARPDTGAAKTSPNTGTAGTGCDAGAGHARPEARPAETRADACTTETSSHTRAAETRAAQRRPCHSRPTASREAHPATASREAHSAASARKAHAAAVPAHANSAAATSAAAPKPPRASASLVSTGPTSSNIAAMPAAAVDTRRVARADRAGATAERWGFGICE